MQPARAEVARTLAADHLPASARASGRSPGSLLGVAWSCLDWFGRVRALSMEAV
jgi:hypothetical protein